MLKILEVSMAYLFMLLSPLFVKKEGIDRNE